LHAETGVSRHFDSELISCTLKKLSRWATENPEDHYRDLYSLLCNDTWLRVAHHAVNTNQGRETAGIDGVP